MKKTKQILLVLIAVLLILSNLMGVTYAESETITEDKFKETFKNVIEVLSKDSEEKVDVEISNNIVTFSSEGETYKINYDLESNPKFTVETPIKQGMSYEEFCAAREEYIACMFGYIAIANIKGVSVEDAVVYFLTGLFKSGLSSFEENKEGYVILDDIKGSEDNPFVPEDAKVIYASEIEKDVIKYAKLIYQDGVNVTDEDEEKAETFNMTMSLKEESETQAKLVSTLTVNLKADFSKLNGAYENFGEDFDINLPGEDENNEEGSTDDEEQITNTIPDAGIENNNTLMVLYGILVISVLSIVMLSLTGKNKK